MGPASTTRSAKPAPLEKKAITLYYLADHLGSATALTNKQGHLLEQISYDSYGNSTGSASTRYDYTGRERDSLTGLLHYRARWYDPQLGRFISEDPIGLAGGINSFAYVRNNPARFTDPSGLCPQDSGKRWIGGDRLSDCYKKLLKSSFAFDLADVSIHHYIPLGPRVWADPDGYTFGYDIYFKNFNPSTEQGFKDLLHELTHVQHFRELGYIGFPKEYLKEYRQNRKKGMS